MSSPTHPPLADNRSEGRESAVAAAGGTFGLLWLTWRQHRWMILGSLFIAAVLTGWMAYLAVEMTTLHHQCHDMVCPTNSPEYATLYATYGPVRISQVLLLAVRYVPLLIGVFVGIPLLTREHEQRTLVLAWSQDVSPVRWLWTKLALLGLFVAALSAAVSAVSDHLAHVLTAIGEGDMWTASQFLDSGMLPLAAGVCWLAAGVALGAAIRRTLPALLGVVAGFIGLTLFVQSRYPTLLTPLSVSLPYGSARTPSDASGALIINNEVAIGPGLRSNLFDASGHELNYAALQRICPDLGSDPTSSCLIRNHLLTQTVYQPDGRIPVFHLILASGYLGLGAVAVAAVWLIVRHTDLNAG